MIGGTTPYWIIQSKKAILFYRDSGRFIALIEQTSSVGHVRHYEEVDVYPYFLISVYLGPISRYRFWREFDGEQQRGCEREYPSIQWAAREVAKALEKIGLHMGCDRFEIPDDHGVI